MQKYIPLTLIMASSVFAAQKDGCENKPGAACYASSCDCVYCLGRPSPEQGNAPVNPKTCNGDLWLEVAGFYWNAHQDGMAYAIKNKVANPGNNPVIGAVQDLNQIIDAHYLTPDFDWNFGAKFGVGYASPCDGWDFSLLWTWYKGSAKTHAEAEADDNQVLIALWSAFSPAPGSIVYATDIETKWKVDLNLVDLEMGRDFWVSRLLSIRPHVGIRYANIKQDFDIEHKGGAFSENDATQNLQNGFNNYVDIDNDFRGVGLRAGLDSTWNLGCGWAIYGNLAASLVYGKFSVDHDEWNRDVEAPFKKTQLLETGNHFRVTRPMVDLVLGLQYATLFCDCDYGLTVQLGWEQHLFFHQNQMWRVVRIGDTTSGSLPNNSGENVFHQRRGNLDTEGVTLTVKFAF